MKKILYISGVLFLMITGISCSDDFLLKNNENWYVLPDTLYLNNSQQNVETSVELHTLTNSNYSIFMQPKWLSFNTMHGKLSGGIASLSFSILKDYLAPGYLTQYGTIMLDIENIGFISFIVAYSNYGSPALQCSASSLNFESSSYQTFTIKNTSEGILNWEITEIPDWLVISETTGSLGNGNTTTIIASLNFDNITGNQDLSGTLEINSNSITGGFTVAVNVPAKAIIPSEVREINGIVTDAEFNHESGIMVICTKSPNSLIVFNTNTNVSNTISLGKTPDCVSLSEDGHKAVIGYSVASVSYINIDNLDIINDFNIDCIPYDIVLGDNGWCYITPTADQWVFFRSLNLNSGELIIGRNGYTVYERTLIRKIPGKTYLVGSRMGLSPTGLLIFNVTKGPASDSISYYHEDIGPFWISADGARLYSSNKKVYSMPEYNGLYNFTTPPVYGQIESELLNISGVEECEAINSTFIFSSYFDYPAEFSTLIEQYNTISLNKINQLHVGRVFLTIDGIRHLYETDPKFIFVNKEGSTLYAVKNLKESIHKDYWSIEAINLRSGKN